LSVVLSLMLILYPSSPLNIPLCSPTLA